MKFAPKACITLLIVCLITNSVNAQQDQTITPSPTQTPTLNSERQQQEEIDRILGEKAEIRDIVRSEVNNTFGWTLSLLNLLVAVLIAIPVATGIALFLLRRSILDRLVSDIETELKQQLEVAKQRMIELQELMDQREIIIRRLAKIIPSSEEEVVSFATKQQVKELVGQLEALQLLEPQLLSTANDYVVQGDGFLTGGRYSEALDSYNNAIQIQPLNHEALIGKGRVLRKLKKYEEALFAYNKALEISPGDASGWNSRGNTLYSLKRYEEALESFDKAIQMAPEFYDPWVNRSRSLDELGLYDAAEVSLDKAIEISSDQPQAYQNRAFHYAKVGNIDLSIKNLREAIRLEPSSVDDGILFAHFLDPIRESEQFKQLVSEHSR
ncbi:MAG: hypothetical protein DCF32_04905 [Leptolyngbya sp.]|nr:MAG: hypothetical protein DCF32_04905 [Leptolyngbya sp.]